MGEQHTANKHYAILIGIDSYPVAPLTSCVRDVNTIRKCLVESPYSIDIRTFTAGGSEPAPPLETLPTCGNVISALTSITSQAEEGDFVYLHYSGHGTRSKPCFDFSNHSTGDLALVLLKKDKSDVELLLGPMLASLLKRMVDNGLVVTVVLDCCFSASVYRNSGGNVRYLPHSPVATSTASFDLNDGLTRNAIYTKSRDASMRDNWLLDPDRYTILAACGPHETAKGGAIETSKEGERYGALSYFLSKTLSHYGLRRKHKDIHRHLCARFWESCVSQHPVLYGNGRQGFFGQVDLDHDVKSLCITAHEGEFHIPVGRAHGLCDGDRFSISPLGSGNLPSEEREFMAKAGVTYVGPLTSELELLNAPCSIQTGWTAEPLTCSYLAKYLVRLGTSIPHHDEWQTQLTRRSLVTSIDSRNQHPMFQVELINNKYEIFDNDGQKISNLPPVTLQDQADIGRVCDVLEHLARFNMAKDLTNESTKSSFRESFDIRIINQNRESFGPGEQMDVQDNDVIKIVMSNKGETVLYVHLYDLSPCRGVENMLSAYEVIHPRNDIKGFTGFSTKKIRMTKPLVIQDSCEDIIKVFITSLPTSFDMLELPKLHELAKGDAGHRVTPSYDHVSEDWISLQFSIRISQPTS
ncbi:putative caspase [Hypoxylon rubiginosum]|uniref:Caspase n=1 Tax=Hypoxylon rubiginosum TaxID=110542 RepID=A0ACC0D3Q1_9PEZI|nr:putative caspase [Hypoxylon rubiginosum]